MLAIEIFPIFDHLPRIVGSSTYSTYHRPNGMLEILVFSLNVSITYVLSK